MVTRRKNHEHLSNDRTADLLVAPHASLLLLNLKVCLRNQVVLGIITPSEIPSALCLSSGGKAYSSLRIFLGLISITSVLGS